MAGLDVAAGIAGLASTGFTVAKGLFDIADAISSAGEEVRLCAEDTYLFSRLLVNLENLLRNSISKSPTPRCIAESFIAKCKKILERFQCLLSKLVPLLEHYKKSQHKLRQFGLRLQWYFKYKSKITLHRLALDQHKSSLMCLLSTMNLEESRLTSSSIAGLIETDVELSQRIMHGGFRPRTAPNVDDTCQEADQNCKLLSSEAWEDLEDSGTPNPQRTIIIGVKDKAKQVLDQSAAAVEDNLDIEIDQQGCLELYNDVVALRNQVWEYSKQIRSKALKGRPSLFTNLHKDSDDVAKNQEILISAINEVHEKVAVMSEIQEHMQVKQNQLDRPDVERKFKRRVLHWTRNPLVMFFMSIMWQLLSRVLWGLAQKLLGVDIF